AVTTLKPSGAENSVFWNTEITSFDELQYFTGLTSIEENAFMFCNSLTSVTLPNAVTSIGSYAFAHCISLTSVSLPNSLTTIGDFAFTNATSLSTIELPLSLMGIGARAFDNCGLVSVVIPASVMGIGINPFTYCSSLTSITVDGPSNVFYTPNDNALVNSQTQTLVTGLSTTIIPNTVTTIGAFAFDGCINLTSITIPNSVTYIDNLAFHYCIGLTSITVEATTPPTLGNDVFQAVPVDIPVYVPCGTKEAYQAAAGWNAFTNIVDLCDVIVFADANVKAICVQNWDTNGDGELSYGEAAAVTTLIPDGASNSAFRNTTITSFNELQYFTGLSSIETLAFHHCTSLTSVIIPSGVDAIGVNPFSYCPALESITVMAGNTVYDSRGNCNAIIETATNTLKAGCKNTVIPSEVTSIASGAFDYCTSLLSITIPSGVAFIDNYVFNQCSGLTSITVEATTPPTANSSTFIGVPRNIPVYVPCNTKAAYQAASGWSNFINIIDFCDAIVFADANVKAICVSNWDTNGDGELSYAEAAAVTSLGQVFQNAFQEEGTNVTFNELQYFTGLTSIGANAFAGCWRLTSVTLPPTVTTIGSNAFTMCSGLASSPITNHVTEIGDYAFNYCYSLTEIELPSSVTSIGNRAFDRCYYLTSVVIPASVTSIGINPFSGCTRLASIVVDEGNTVYGSPNGCNAIINTEEHLLVSGCNNTNIPDGVQTIGWYAFLASGLTTLTIPASVNSIADYAFSECEALSELTLLATTPPTLEGTDVFSYINLDIPVYVPCEWLELYQTYNNGQPWGGFTNIRCDVCSAELPLSENFDSYQGTTSGATNVLPDCWDRINTAVDIAYTGYPTILNEPANAYSGSNYLRFHYNQGYGSEQYVILPYVDNIAEVNLWFYAKALTENAAIFVGVMTDPNDVSTFETAFEIDNLTSDYQQCNVSIDPEYINDQTHYIAIKTGANNGATQCDLCIDNLELLRMTQQNLTLAEGWNWWTPTVRTYRSALQYALGSKGIIINSQDQGFQKNNGNYWSGTLPGVLEPGQMFKIKTNAAVSATLQGLEVNQPTITIVAGYNWFGYAGAQAADIATAIDILGVSPTDGDIITDKNGNTATYNGSGWSGTLTTLQPGHGYVYRRQ
ncbi:MAG: leucine-rich repeat domain-containing protein, partial [Bacteroidales bacterium]|nr:leucine-rich repeat domain-containing protein [Bacteroidales bacterium]